MLVIFLTFPSHPSSFSWLLCKASYLKPSLQISLYYSNKKPSTSTRAESEPKRTAVLKSFDRMHFLHFLGKVTCWKSLFFKYKMFSNTKIKQKQKNLQLNITCNNVQYQKNLKKILKNVIQRYPQENRILLFPLVKVKGLDRSAPWGKQNSLPWLNYHRVNRGLLSN